MEKIVECLKNLKLNMPLTCTRSNLSKLYDGFIEYKQQVNGLPDIYGNIKKEYEHNFISLEHKINAITDHSNSQKDAKYYFKDAVCCLHIEIDNIIASIMRVNNTGSII